MPKYTKFTVQFLSLADAHHQVVDSKVLMVLGNNLNALIVKEYKVFDVIQQTFLAEKTINKVCDRKTMFCYLLTVKFLLFIVNTKPFKEELISSIPCSELCL